MKDGALDLWNDLDGPETHQTQAQAQTQIQAQASPQIDLRNRNLNNYSQIRGYRSVPEVSDSIRSVPRVRDLSDQKRVGMEKPERRRIWRKNDSSSDSESENEVESKNEEGYYSKVGSIAALGKYDVKRVRRMKPKDFDDETDFSEQVELIKNELKKKKLLRHEEENQGQELENVLSQTRFDKCAISPLTIKALSASGYTHMTRVQETSLPICLEGNDVMVKAKTGTGKTAAFLF